MSATQEFEEHVDRSFSVRLLAARDDHEHAAVLTVAGDIDLGTAPVLRAALLPVLEHQTGSVVVDLSEVPFMDSSGVHVLIDTLEQFRLENRRLAIACREGGQVHRVLTLLGLLEAVTVYPSRESAVIGGDDRLRAEPDRSRRVFAAQTLSGASEHKPTGRFMGSGSSAPLLEISNAIVWLYKEAFGRGPTRVRTTFAGPDMVLVLLEDALTATDRALLALGEIEALQESRLRVQEALEERARSAVESVLGRQTLAFITGIDPHRSVVVNVFTLESTSPERCDAESQRG